MKRWMLWRTVIFALGALLVQPELSAEFASGQDLDGPHKFRIASDIAEPGSVTDHPGRPAMGFDGTNYLVVSCRSIGPSAGLFGVTLSNQGTVLKDFHISDYNCTYPMRATPSIAFDGTNYLVVFGRDGQIFGARVSPSGDVLDLPTGFRISSGLPSGSSSSFPAVAFDGANYMVVWSKFIDAYVSPYDIYGARVTPEGQVLDEIPIFRAPSWQINASIAFDGVNYLVVWEDERSGYDATDVYGGRVTPEGVVLDPEGIPISTAPKSQGEPHVAFDGMNYLVVWQDGRQSAFLYDPYHLDIYGARIDKAGVLLDGPPDTGGVAINTAILGAKGHPRVSFEGTNYFVIWEVGSYSTNPPAGIFAARVSRNGLLIDGPANGMGIFISVPDCYACQLVYPNLLFNGENVLITWVRSAESSSSFKDMEGVIVYPASANSGADFWSMTLRNDWNYYGTNLSGGAWTYYRVIDEIDAETNPGLMTYVSRGNDSGGNRESIWFSISSSKLKEWRQEIWDPTSQRLVKRTFDDGLVRIKNPILVGDSWTSETTGTSDITTYPRPFPVSIPVIASLSVQVLSRDYVTVPYGTYLAYKILQSLYVSDYIYVSNPGAVRTIWFVPYLGIVKIENGLGKTEVLTSMNISRSGTFLDVLSSHFALNQIDAITAAGITGGCSAGPPPQFCPEDGMTRGQMAVFIEGSLGNPPNTCEGRFADVPVGNPFCGFIERLADDGITGGCTATRFCPDDPVTRGQMAVFIESAIGNSPNPCAELFIDVPPDHPFCGFVERLADDGITGGCGGGNFCPDNPVTRAQMAVFLVAGPPPLSP